MAIAIPLYAQAPQEISNVSENFIQAEKIQYVSENEIKNYIFSVFGENGNKAYNIMLCESGGKVKAFNPETKAKEKGITQYGSYGLFQINAPYDERLYDWKYNIDFAYKEKFLKGGFERHWKICSSKTTQRDALRTGIYVG